MKQRKLFYLVVMMVFYLISAMINPTSGNIVEGKTIMIYTGNSASHTDMSGFYSNYSHANTVINNTEIDFTTELNANVDALFLPANEGFSLTSINAISNWFALGNKLLWVAGDSDYGGYFIARDLNPVLESVGSVLRIDAGAIDDLVSNDGSGYRVVSTGVGNGEIAQAITKDMINVSLPFHAPTSIYYMNNEQGADLRSNNVENVEVIIFSSPYAKVLDQDVSMGDDDFYYSTESYGNYPLLAVERIGNSTVVASGECNFCSYKTMYGTSFEKSRNPHLGSEFVDSLISYFLPEIVDISNITVTTSIINTPPVFVPINGTAVMISITFVTILTRKLKQRKYSIIK